GVLHREVGGRAVMARQLRQLIEAATTQPNVTVQVIPFTAGAHAAVEGSFAIIEFGVEPGAVLLEGKTADLFLEEPEEIAAYQDTASRLQRSALGADDTVALIEQMLREMT
ncbi:MAG: transcriptional regulator, partial [Pseudonocardiales bacterium]